MEIEDITQVANNEIKTQKNALISQIEELENEREHNEFLLDIAKDLKKYKMELVSQREKQKEHLLKILNYLDDLMETNAVTKYTLQHTQNEQNRLVQEIKEIQKDINNIY
jgi:uncharacterized protein (UPF0335 family)